MAQEPIHQHDALMATLPPAWPTDLMAMIRAAIHKRNDKIIVLDDDPTGTQTVHDTAVLTTWDVPTLVAELQHDDPCVYILTNSRSMIEAEATALNLEIARNVQAAAGQAGRTFVIISRSDSTLRGHFPAETRALAQALEGHFDGVLIIPAFMAGGRYTINDVHYVREGADLVPASRTPFAQDAAFGYENANLRAWVAEKCGGVVAPADVAAISLDTIRGAGAAAVAQQLQALHDEQYCVVNAVTERDLEVVTFAVLEAEAKGKRFLYRTAASFAAIRAGIALRPVLSAGELRASSGAGGLIVVGSYVPKTTAQVNILRQRAAVQTVELDVLSLLQDATQQDVIKTAIESIDRVLQAGETALLMTSRELVTGDDAASSLSIGNRISDSLVRVVRGLRQRPRYLIAKGGITSSDLATKALGVRRARVMGQILPGIPAWRLGDECKYDGLVYIVFPGNVGSDDALAQAVETLGDQ